MVDSMRHESVPNSARQDEVHRMRRPLLTIGLIIVAFFVFMTLLSPKGPSGSEALAWSSSNLSPSR